MALPGVGMSILEISHRSKPFDEVIEGCEADLRALAGIPANYHVLFLQGGREPPVLDGADEPPAAGRLGRLHRHRLVVGEGREGSEARGRGQDRRVDRVGELRARAEAERADARPGRRLRALHDEQHDLRHRVARRAGRRPRAARRRHVVRHVQPSDRRREVRAHLRRRAEEPRALGVDARHHPRRSGGAHAGVARDHAAVRRARREQVDVQHAAGVRRLHHAARR